MIEFRSFAFLGFRVVFALVCEGKTGSSSLGINLSQQEMDQVSPQTANVFMQSKHVGTLQAKIFCPDVGAIFLETVAWCADDRC